MDIVVDPTPVEVLAVVQARGGSVSVPGKNARLLGGHPLLAYSVAAGLCARSVTRLIISTDDRALAAIAQEYGAEAPFLRPPELAGNESPDLPLFEHALAFLKEQDGYEPDVLVQLRPTSPLRPGELIDSAVTTLLSDPSADSVRSVVPASQNPYKMWTVSEAGYLAPLLALEGEAEPYNAPRQRLPQVVWQTGHVDVFRRATVARGSLTGQRVLPLVVDRIYAVDIDSEADLAMAEGILARSDYPGVRPSARLRRARLAERSRVE